eukprot:gene1837-29021_t
MRPLRALPLLCAGATGSALWEEGGQQPRPCGRGGDNLPPAVAQQRSFAVTINAASGGEVFSSGVVQGAEQNYTLPRAVALAPARRYTVRVSVNGAAAVSVPQPFFTALNASGHGGWAAAPIWAPRPGGGDAPAYAHFAGSSALAFVTAEGPLTLPPFGCCGEFESGTKILGAYKMFLNGRVVGMGPGRSRCPSTLYDGYDVTDDARGAAALNVLIHGYGVAQPRYNVTQRVLCQLVVRYTDGTEVVLSTGEHWAAFDATALYNPEGNSGGAFGYHHTYWYSYPHENINASCAPPPPDAASPACPAFTAPLVAKPVAPVALSSPIPIAVHL